MFIQTMCPALDPVEVDIEPDGGNEGSVDEEVITVDGLSVVKVLLYHNVLLLQSQIRCNVFLLLYRMEGGGGVRGPIGPPGAEGV